MAFNYVHHSGRFSHSPAELAHGFELDLIKHRADIIAVTEVSNENRAIALDARARMHNWGFFRGRGAGHDECALTWDTEKFEFLDGHTKILTKIDTFTPEGRKRAPFGATFVVLKERATGDVFIFTVAHTPSHVQEGNGWHENNRARQHRVGCRRMHREAKALKREFKAVAGVISLDVNLNITARWVKAYLAATFPTYHLLIDPNPEATKGNRTIDCVLVTRRLRKKGRVNAYKAADSDHKTIIVRLLKRILNK